MAPEASKRKSKENQYIFNVGVRGRKTGLTVADSGIRDENGLEPMDNLFSSPQKASQAKKVNGSAKILNATISSEEDMDVDENTVPEPTDVISERASRGIMRQPLPQSKSPIKTFLQSPARRLPSLGPLSSPSRNPRAEPQATTASAFVRRKLDFSNDNLESNILESSAISESPHKRVTSTKKPATAKLTNGTKLAPALTEEDDQDGQDETSHTDEYGSFVNRRGYAGADSDVDAAREEAEETIESELESEPIPSRKDKGKVRAVDPEVVAVPVKGKRGRKPKNPNPPEVDEVEDEPPAKRTRRSLEGPVAAPEPTSKSKPGRPAKSRPASKESKPAAPAAQVPEAKAASKAAAKKSKLAPIAEAESPEAQRGPPLPRNNRGLMILRRETPGVGVSFKQTRSGRNSIKPVAYWKNERVEYSEDEMEDIGGKFLTSRIKEVVRVDEVQEKKKRKYYYRPNKGKKPAAAAESDDEETEPWEVDPGRIIAPYRFWDPEDPTGLQQPEDEAELALSSAAIQTRDIAGATFKFAKTLTLPFFGSGMVDLPAGSEKKTKNSRRMQMVFFVYFGRVEVTVNDTTFGIGKGGMWQVPRGNHYSIVNDYDKPARIFFAQGCEVEEGAIDDH